MFYVLRLYSPQQLAHVGHHLIPVGSLSPFVKANYTMFAFKTYYDMALIFLLSFICRYSFLMIILFHAVPCLLTLQNSFGSFFIC